MNWWKAKYSFQRPNWHAFGHILFLVAESPEQAEYLAREQVAAIEPGATITHFDVTSASDAEQRRHAEKVERRERWIDNVAHGVPNHRGDL